MAFELTPWRPFREIAPFRDFERMRREMDRLWNELFENASEKKEQEAWQWYERFPKFEGPG